MTIRRITGQNVIEAILGTKYIPYFSNKHSLCSGAKFIPNIFVKSRKYIFEDIMVLSEGDTYGSCQNQCRYFSYQLMCVDFIKQMSFFIDQRLRNRLS